MRFLLAMIASVLLSQGVQAGKERGGGNALICFDSAKTRNTVKDRVRNAAYLGEVEDTLYQFESSIESVQFWDLAQVEFNKNFQFLNIQKEPVSYLNKYLDELAKTVPYYSELKNRLNHLYETRTGFEGGVKKVFDSEVRGSKGDRCLRIQLGFNDYIDEKVALLTENVFLLEKLSPVDKAAFYLHEALYSLVLSNHGKVDDSEMIQIKVRDLLNTKKKLEVEDLRKVFSDLRIAEYLELSHIETIDFLGIPVQTLVKYEEGWGGAIRSVKFLLEKLPAPENLDWHEPKWGMQIFSEAGRITIKSDSYKHEFIGSYKNQNVERVVLERDGSGNIEIVELTPYGADFLLNFENGVYCTKASGTGYLEDNIILKNNKVVSCFQNDTKNGHCGPSRRNFDEKGQVVACVGYRNDYEVKIDPEDGSYSVYSPFGGMVASSNVRLSESEIQCDSPYAEYRKDGKLKACEVTRDKIDRDKKALLRKADDTYHGFYAIPSPIGESKIGIRVDEDGYILQDSYLIHRPDQRTFDASNVCDLTKKLIKLSVNDFECTPKSSIRDIPLEEGGTVQYSTNRFGIGNIAKVVPKKEGYIEYKNQSYPYFTYKGAKVLVEELSLERHDSLKLTLLEGSIGNCKPMFELRRGKYRAKSSSMSKHSYRLKDLENRCMN